MIPNWHAVRGADLAQGDLIHDCVVPLIRPTLTLETAAANVDFTLLNVIVITQSCDLVNLKAGLAALCPIHALTEFEAINPAYSRKGAWEDVRKGRREGLHLLASPVDPFNNRESLVVDFREIFSLPVGYLENRVVEIGERWRLTPPFLEHFSQAFARFFMRVGLPSAIAPFTT